MAEDIAQWLDRLGLGQYAQAFAENGVELQHLPHLTDDDLKELCLPLGPRRHLQAAIETLSTDQPSIRPTVTSAQEPETLPAEAERRQLTIMFCDLVGSTELSQSLDPEDLREVMRRYQDVVAGEIARYEGHLAKFMGDGVIAYFGYPLAHEDDAERAVRAGLAIVEAMAGLAPGETPLQVRIGIATGQVVVGDLIGEGAAQEEAVTGETPNLAARLQELAPPGGVVISEATHKLAGHVFDCADLGTQMLKGIATPARVWRIDSERQLESRFEARAGSLTSFVGREHEVGMLLERWQRALAGEGQVVLLSGEAGIGKSRVLETIRERLATEVLVRLHCQCSPYHANSALHPSVGQLERAAGFATDDAAEARLDKLETLLAETSDDLSQVVPLLAALLSLPLAGRYPPLELSPQLQKTRTLAALADQVSALARHQPVLFLFEDAHWIDPTSLELLELMIDRAAEERVMIVITHRPEFEAPWQRQAHVGTLALNQLSAGQCREMVGQLTRGKPLPEDVLAQIADKTDGVPLFVEELTKTVIESGLLAEAAEGCQSTGPLSPLAIPNTLQDSLMARLDRLGGTRELAQIGAAIGREFSHRLIQAVAPLDDLTLDTALEQLIDAELIFRRGQGAEASYLFKHALVQDTDYESLLRSRRQALHLDIAKALDETLPETVESQPELLAHHYTEAGLTEQAIDYWRKAGEQALRRAANVEAINHLMKGWELLQSLPETRERDQQELPLQLTLGPAFMTARGQGASEVGEAYARARELGHRLGDTQQHFRAVWGSWRHRFMLSEHTRARELGAECLELAEDAGETAFILGALFACGGSLLLMGDLSAARGHLERAIALHDDEEHRALGFLYGHDPGPSNLSYMSWLLWLSGYPEQSVASGRAGLDMAKASHHPLTTAMVHMYSGISYGLCRNWSAVRSVATAAIDLAEAQGLPQVLTYASVLHGRALVEAGDFEHGIPQIEQAIAQRKAIDVRAARLFELAQLAEAYGKADRTDEGLGVVVEALEHAEGTSEGFHLPELHRLKGLLLLGQGQAATERCFHQAIEIARRQKSLSLELRAATSLGELWRDQGRTDAARDLLAPIYGRFTEGFETPDLKDAKALLNELA